jgi:hypothetical protein
VLNEDGTINRKQHEKHPAVTATETQSPKAQSPKHNTIMGQTSRRKTKIVLTSFSVCNI